MEDCTAMYFYWTFSPLLLIDRKPINSNTVKDRQLTLFKDRARKQRMKHLQRLQQHLCVTEGNRTDPMDPNLPIDTQATFFF